MSRIGRSFQLVGESYRILMQDKELMVLPLIAGTIMVAAVAGVATGFGFTARDLEEAGPAGYAAAFLLYVVLYAVGIFFQAAVVAGATERMRGGDPTVGSALRAAARRLGPIVLWAVVAATVGMILRAIQERARFIGRIIAGLLGAAWSLGTFFVVPVLVLEERPLRDSFTRSVNTFKAAWGETVAGGVSFGVAAACAWVTLVASVGLISWIPGMLIPAMAVFILGAVGLGTFFSTLNGIYMAALYRYATEGATTGGLSPALLREAFVPRRGR